MSNNTLKLKSVCRELFVESKKKAVVREQMEPMGGESASGGNKIWSVQVTGGGWGSERHEGYVTASSKEEAVLKHLTETKGMSPEEAQENLRYYDAFERPRSRVEEDFNNKKRQFLELQKELKQLRSILGKS